MKDVFKTYEMPSFKANDIKVDDNSTAKRFNYSVAFEEIVNSFVKEEDEAIINWLYKKYKDTNVARIYVLSQAEFEKFLLEMLPKYMEG